MLPPNKNCFQAGGCKVSSWILLLTYLYTVVQFQFSDDDFLSAVVSIPTLHIGGAISQHGHEVTSSNFDWDVICHSDIFLWFLSVLWTRAMIYFN
jgi:hypothetical protein